MDFKLNKKQKDVLYGLTKLTRQKLIYYAPLFINEDFTPYWRLEVVRTGRPVKRFILATIESLKKLGMVRIKFIDGQPKTAYITTSGRNYVKSLAVPNNDRLDMDVLHRIHQMVYHPVRKEKKRQKNK
jgi:hypothetical protein